MKILYSFSNKSNDFIFVIFILIFSILTFSILFGTKRMNSFSVLSMIFPSFEFIAIYKTLSFLRNPLDSRFRSAYKSEGTSKYARAQYYPHSSFRLLAFQYFRGQKWVLLHVFSLFDFGKTIHHKAYSTILDCSVSVIYHLHLYIKYLMFY